MTEMQTFSDVYVETQCIHCSGNKVNKDGTRCWLCDGDGTIEVPEDHPWAGLGDVYIFSDEELSP